MCQWNKTCRYIISMISNRVDTSSSRSRKKHVHDKPHPVTLSIEEPMCLTCLAMRSKWQWVSEQVSKAFSSSSIAPTQTFHKDMYHTEHGQRDYWDTKSNALVQHAQISGRYTALAEHEIALVSKVLIHPGLHTPVLGTFRLAMRRYVWHSSTWIGRWVLSPITWLRESLPSTTCKSFHHLVIRRLFGVWWRITCWLKLCALAGCDDTNQQVMRHRIQQAHRIQRVEDTMSFICKSYLCNIETRVLEYLHHSQKWMFTYS